MSIDFQSTNKEVIGNVSYKGLPMEDGDLAIYNTKKLNNLIGITLGDILLHAEKTNKVFTKLNISDENFNLSYALADLLLIGKIGTVSEPDWDVTLNFDVDENLYISRNSDGQVFRINTKESNPVADLFAYGPSSSNNDGARCALAPVIDTETATIDFGDAPASYGTLADDNGARHSTENNAIFMGASVDAEFDSFQFPLSDDETDGNNDDDGVAFVTGIEVGKQFVGAS